MSSADGQGRTIYEALAQALSVEVQAPAKATPPARLNCAYCGVERTPGTHYVGEPFRLPARFPCAVCGDVLHTTGMHEQMLP